MVLMARALVAKTNPSVTCPPPPPLKTLEEAKSRPYFLSYAKAHDEELDRHRPNGLHTYYFVEALPSDKPILYTMTYKARTNQHGVLERHNLCPEGQIGDKGRPHASMD